MDTGFYMVLAKDLMKGAFGKRLLAAWEEFRIGGFLVSACSGAHGFHKSLVKAYSLNHDSNPYMMLRHVL